MKSDAQIKLEDAQGAVAQAAQQLERVTSSRPDGYGIIVTEASWHNLQEALKEWRDATQAFLQELAE